MDRIFIKMCQEASEIQDGWEPDRGDLVWNTVLKQVEMINDSLSLDQEFWKGGRSFKWLPGQEDLQKIYLNHLRKQLKHPKIIQLDGFLLFPMADWYNSPKHAKLTITQAWLCFVMETVYNKRWNGNTWEVI